MKKMLIFLLCIAFSGCNDAKHTKKTPIGGEKDTQGCLIAAGQSWSQLRGACIQVFNEGIRLNPAVIQSKDAVILSAFVLFDDEKTKAEIFLPDRKESLILEKTEEATYEKDGYRFYLPTGVLLTNGTRYEREKLACNEKEAILKKVKNEEGVFYYAPNMGHPVVSVATPNTIDEVSYYYLCNPSQTLPREGYLVRISGNARKSDVPVLMGGQTNYVIEVESLEEVKR